MDPRGKRMVTRTGGGRRLRRLGSKRGRLGPQRWRLGRGREREGSRHRDRRRTMWLLRDRRARRELGARDDGRDLARPRRGAGGAAGRGRDAIDDRPESGQVAERLASVRKLQPRATRVLLRECHVDEARVFADRTRKVALIRERGGETTMRGKIRRSDGNGLEQQGDSGRAIPAHRTRRLRAHAGDQTIELSGTDGVGVDAERVEFGGEERLRSGPEVALGYTEQLLRKRVQSSPVVASS